METKYRWPRRPSDWKVSIGTGCTTHQHQFWPLYKVPEFYEKQDVELLFGEVIGASDFNDDALERALDVLHDSDIETLYTELAMSTTQSLKVTAQFDGFLPIHSDTTSLSLYGEYPDQDDIEIVRRYSKAPLPDLKQMLFGLSTVRGVPLYGNVNNRVNPTKLDEMLLDLPQLFVSKSNVFILQCVVSGANQVLLILMLHLFQCLRISLVSNRRHIVMSRY